jgi:hypothetical protein
MGLSMKTQFPTSNRTMHCTCKPLFGCGQVLLRNTAKPVTPFGGLVVFIEFLHKLGYAACVQAHLPFHLSSPNAIAPAHTLTAFIFAVVAGARRFAHSELLRADRALHALLGLKRFPGHDTIRGLFLRFGQADIETFWRPFWRWLLGWVKPRVGGFTLDLDSTIFQRAGQQQGARKGYNPRRPGRRSHHPLLAVLAEAHFVLHAWLRSGNTGAAQGVVAFLQEALALLPEGWGLRLVRADAGFFEEALLGFLAARGLRYIVVARMTKQVKSHCRQLKPWVELDADYAVGEFEAQLLGWSRPRRFVVVRERVREKKEAVGRKLIDVPGYTFRVLVTNTDLAAVEVWRTYNGRAGVEQRIEELKNDLAADDFCTRQFFATEAAFLAVVATFNLLSLFQAASAPDQYRQPATLRAQVFLCGAVLGRHGREPVLYLSLSWGGLERRKPLREAILQWRKPTPEKLAAHNQILSLSA